MIARAFTSFAYRELVAPVGLWERGAEASGIIPPSARLLTETGTQRLCEAPTTAKSTLRAPKANATPPSGGTGGSIWAPFRAIDTATSVSIHARTQHSDSANNSKTR